MNERLKRITDLFVEGKELHLGDDDTGPILIWINKLNSFETDDVRRDALVRRGERLSELAKVDSPERTGILAEMKLWELDRLVEEYLNTKADERYLEAMDDLQTDKSWRDLLERLQRAPVLHDVEDVPEDDPRRQQHADDNAEYVRRTVECVEKLEEQARKDLKGQSRKDVEKSYFEQWRQRQTLNEFMQARRHAEMFYSMRACDGTGEKLDAGWKWDHSKCDHSKRYLDDRSEIRGLPEDVIQRVNDLMDDIRLTDRESGNSDAPPSSSGSSEPSSTPEAASTPSSPEETPSDAPTT